MINLMPEQESMKVATAKRDTVERSGHFQPSKFLPRLV